MEVRSLAPPPDPAVLALLGLLSLAPAGLGGPHVSAIRPEGGACVWRCTDATTGESRVLSRFPPPCSQVEMAWSPDRGQVLLLLAGEEPVGDLPVTGVEDEDVEVPDWVLYLPPAEIARYRAARGQAGQIVPRSHHVDRLRFIDVATGEARSLPPPDRARLAGVGFDRAGIAHAYTLLSSEPVLREGRRVHEFEGKTYSAEGLDWGAPHLALAYRLVGDDWERVEVVATNAEAVDTLGISHLDHARNLAPHTRHYLGEGMVAREEPLPVPWAKPADARLDPLGQWQRMLGVEPPLWFWNDDCCTVNASGLLLWQAGDRMELLPGLTLRPRDHVRVQVQAGVALVTEVGTGRAAHLYDLANRRHLGTDVEARAAVLCPDATCYPPASP